MYSDPFTITIGAMTVMYTCSIYTYVNKPSLLTLPTPTLKYLILQTHVHTNTILSHKQTLAQTRAHTHSHTRTTPPAVWLFQESHSVGWAAATCDQIHFSSQRRKSCQKEQSMCNQQTVHCFPVLSFSLILIMAFSPLPSPLLSLLFSPSSLPLSLSLPPSLPPPFLIFPSIYLTHTLSLTSISMPSPSLHSLKWMYMN